MYYLFALFAFIGGGCISFQAPINAKLGSIMGGPLVSAFLSFLVGTLALGFILVVTNNLPQISEVRNTSPWMWVGGLLGAVFVWMSITVVPNLGAALMISLVIAGQILLALYIDKSGFLLPQAIEISWQRLLGAVFVMIGVILFARY